MKEFKWRTPEYIHKEKSPDWYWTVGIIASALVVTAVIFGDVLFGIVIAIGSFTLALFASRKPNMISVEMNEKGVTIGKMLYPFSSLEAFCVDEAHHHGTRLVLKSKKALVPLVSIPVMGANPDDLRTFLAARLKEETFEQGLMQTIFEKMGF
ncbi:hypothetical protein KW799_01405 [Candidatus Parcubacteria bacterium]|nr:hypothetical protein [Candidatus Parcubacteria bacterium]